MIVNTLGQIVYARNEAVSNKEMLMSMNLDNIPNGTYHIRLYDDEMMRVLKFAISR